MTKIKIELDADLVTAIKYALIAYNFELCRPPRKSEINFEVSMYASFMKGWAEKRDQKLKVVRDCIAKLGPIISPENKEASKAFE